VDRPDAGDSFLTVAEVAEMLKLNQQTVRNWIDQGSLPALRVGRLVRIRQSDFERLIAGGATGGSTDEQGQSAEGFWGGEPVGVAEPAPGAMDGVTADDAARSDDAHSSDPGASPPPAEQRIE
jgi:excisionase family DNA binding protein